MVHIYYYVYVFISSVGEDLFELAYVFVLHPGLFRIAAVLVRRRLFPLCSSVGACLVLGAILKLVPVLWLAVLSVAFFSQALFTNKLDSHCAYLSVPSSFIFSASPSRQDQLCIHCKWKLINERWFPPHIPPNYVRRCWHPSVVSGEGQTWRHWKSSACILSCIVVSIFSWHLVRYGRYQVHICLAGGHSHLYVPQCAALSCFTCTFLCHRSFRVPSHEIQGECMIWVALYASTFCPRCSRWCCCVCPLWVFWKFMVG